MRCITPEDRIRGRISYASPPSSPGGNAHECHSSPSTCVSQNHRQGQPDAQVSLGQAYEYGDGVEQNYVLAAEWYRKAAEHVPDLGGAGQGRNQLGLLYMEGRGVRKDYVQAYMWFSLANHESAVRELRSKMTETQILEAERTTQEWKSRHPSAIMALSDSVAAE